MPEIKTVVMQSPSGELNTRDMKQTLIRIVFAAASVALGSVITYFKQTLLPEVSDEAIFAGVVTIVIGALEVGKRFFDGPPKDAMAKANSADSQYTFDTGISKVK